ncbi:hypothetical protein DFH09DRAFT_1270635 [Mycena vulgaris]|nr:hypothetical protein DFH09DRAFT_1270635 [Mycena vulgaris]
MDSSPVAVPPPSDMTRKCNTNGCKNRISLDSKLRRCDNCRAINRRNQKDSRARAAAAANANGSGTASKKRRRASLGSADDRSATRPRTDRSSEDGTQTRGDAEQEGDSDDDTRGDEDESQVVETFSDAESFCEALRAEFKAGEAVDFHGSYPVPVDPLVSPRTRVEMVAREIWQLSGFRFTVKDHRKLKSGHRTRYWCSQDEVRKKKSKASQNPDIRNRDTVGMKRFPCGSKLSISCRARKDNEDELTVTVQLKHAAKHVTYVDVAMPPEALAMIRDNVEWMTPVTMVAKVQAAFPTVTAAQIHRAWMEMSEPFWRFDDDQLLSTKKVLEEHIDDVDIFEPQDVPEGVEMICWGMKKIATPLKGKIVEIGVDATYNTNSKHLELYSIMGEHDGAGFPLSYLLLSTASSIDQGKRTRALTAWAKCVRDTYGIIAKFTHVDKDMAEIGMLKDVWNAKISLCWWHLRRAVRTRLANAKLATTPYDPGRAHAEFSFIDVAFVPLGQADGGEYEGGIPDIIPPVVTASQQPRTITVANGLRITIRPGTHQPLSVIGDGGATERLRGDESGRAEGGNTECGGEEPSAGTPVPPKKAPSSTAPRSSAKTVIEEKENEAPETHNGMRTRAGRVTKPTHNIDAADPKVLNHAMNARVTRLAAKPAGPKVAKASAKGAAVDPAPASESEDEEEKEKRTRRTFCPTQYREPILAMMEKHYCAHPLLPGYAHPKSHWRRIKHDFLHHFHMPRCDLLAWILIVKLAPTFYRKLDRLLTDTGRYRELSSWRKDFKRAWRRLERTPITLPVNPAYKTDAKKMLCTCPSLPVSRFLLCKHVVQGVEPVPPVFFLEVKRQRTAPFWTHPSLRPVLDVSAPDQSSEDVGSEMTRADVDANASLDSDDDDDYNFVDTQPDGDRRTFVEAMDENIDLIVEFAKGLKFQRQFRDQRMLQALEREGASFLRLARACLGKEKRLTSTRGPAPSTWDKSAGSAMFYRARPAASDDVRR